MKNIPTGRVGGASMKTYSYLCWAALAAAVTLRLPALLRPLYIDELATLDVLREPSFMAAMQALRADTHHPGYFAPLYLWGMVSHATGWLRLPSLLCDGVSLWVLRSFFVRQRPQAALAAVALWGACPIALRNATEIRPYAALSCATLLAFVSAQRFLAQAAASPVPLLHKVWTPACALTCLAWMAAVAMHPVGFMAVVALAAACVLCHHSASPSDVQIFAAGPGSGACSWRSVGAAMGLLALPLLTAVGLFWLLHYHFALDPSGGRISWMPPMSVDLLLRMSNFCLGTDQMATYFAVGVQGSSSHGVGLSLFLMLIAVALWHRQGRAAALAALFHASVVMGFSVLGRPIFWHRSIVPAVMLMGVGAAAALGERRRIAWLWVLPLLAWQVAGYLPQATRPIDPSEVAGIEAVAARQADDAVLVFPSFMRIAVLPHLQAAEQAKALSFAAALQVAVPLGATAVIRGGMDLQDSEPSAAELLVPLRQRGVAVHDWFIFNDERDDLDAPSRARRRQDIDRIGRVFGPCQTLVEGARVAHVHCLLGAAP